jgi:hypothetical protein
MTIWIELELMTVRKFLGAPFTRTESTVLEEPEPVSVTVQLVVSRVNTLGEALVIVGNTL